MNTNPNTVTMNTTTVDGNAGQSIISDMTQQDQQTAPANPQFNQAPPAGQQTDPNQGQPNQSNQQAQQTIPAPQTQTDAQNTLKGVGLDITEFETEFISQGQLSEASYKKLTDAGIPKAMVDSYIKGQEALAQQIIDNTYAIAGGEQNYNKMTEWARKSLTPDEIRYFDHVMSSGNRESITFAVTGLVSRWRAAEGFAPNLVQGRAPAVPQRVLGFQSIDEMKQAMRDPRYGRDSAYTRSVEEKMSRSDLFG